MSRKKANINYKLNIFLTKLKSKTNSIIKKINGLLNSKKIYYVMGFIFIASLSLYIWSLNDPQLFYKNFHGKYREFHIYNLSLKLGIITLISGIIFFIQIFKFYIFEKIKININFNGYINKNFFKIGIVYIVYICLIYFLSFLSNQTKILLILSPIVVYFVYNIYNYIQGTKENYNKWYLIDSRYFFLGALVLLIYTPIFIYFNNKEIAEQLSIYAYYLLIIGVIYEIFIGIFTKQKD